MYNFDTVFVPRFHRLQKMKALYHICDDDTGLADNFDLFLDKFEMDDDGYNVPSILKNVSYYFILNQK